MTKINKRGLYSSHRVLRQVRLQSGAIRIIRWVMLDQLGIKALQLLPPETAHKASLQALKLGLGPRISTRPDPVLATTLAGLNLPHPLGLAAGYDKNADAPDALLKAGFGFVEIGAVTPRPQIGNHQPRLFRLKDDQAVINRMGFNNAGLDVIKTRLEARQDRPGMIGVNLGANKDSEDRTADYVILLESLRELADFFTINISSPNTPGLRDMQSGGALKELLSRVNEARGSEPVFLKVAPDLETGEIETIVQAAQDHHLSGLIVSNTTLARPDTLQSSHKAETGGLSGEPLFDRSTKMLRQVRQMAGPDLAIIGVGGISSAKTAYAKIRAGANALQLYTALVYKGPGLVSEILTGLKALLAADGFDQVSDAVGVDLS